MKKKILLTILCGVCLIGLTGCGMSKEEMIKESKSLNGKQLYKDLTSNFKSAKEKYEGNIYKISAGVISVEEKFAKIELSDIDFDKDYLEVHFNSDDLNKLKKGQKITFVGKISNITNSNNNFNVKIKKAYYIDDIIEITGQVNYHKADSLMIDYCYLDVYFDDKEKTKYDLGNFTKYISTNFAEISGKKIKNGDTITIKAKVEEKDNNTAYDDIWTVTEIKDIKATTSVTDDDIENDKNRQDVKEYYDTLREAAKNMR